MAKPKESQGFMYEALPAGTIDPDEQTDEERSFDDFITGLGAEKMGVLRVGKLKLGPNGTPLAQNRSAHCFTCPIDQYTFDELLDFLREHYGSGLYRVLGIPAGERVKFNKIVEIAEDFKPKKPASESASQNPANLLESVSRIMAESAARTESLIARLSEGRQNAPAPDPMEMMSKLAGLMATIMGVMPKPAAGDDLLGQLEKLAKVKELLGGFSGESNGGAESNFYDVVKTGLASFGPALAQLAIRGAQSPQNPQLPAPAPVHSMPPNAAPSNYDKPTPGTRHPNNGVNDPAMLNFKRQVDTLVQNAKNNVDPMQLAGTILDLTPDEKIDDLANMLEAPDVIDKMASLNPEVNVYRAFFDKLRTSILGLLEETDTDTLAPSGAESPTGGEGEGAPTS